MTLAELFDAVNRIGGRLVRQGVASGHQGSVGGASASLGEVVPVAEAASDTPTPAEPVDEKKWTNPADFFGTLREIMARAAQQQAEASGATVSEVSSR